MKIVFINTFNNGSTGRICSSLGKMMKDKGHEVFYFYGREENGDNLDWTFVGANKFNLLFSRGMSYLTGNVGGYLKKNTKELISKLKEIDPDIIHLHNIHGNYVNFDMLFNYLKDTRAKIVFTLHDEFMATGRCAYIPAGCDRRCHQCDKCLFKKEYPRALFDNAHKLFLKKLEYLSSLKDVLYVSPSNWLKNSFLSSDIGKGRNCIVINNGFDLSYEPKVTKSGDKIKLFAAAFEWSELKGRLVLEKLVDLIDLDKYELTVAGGIQDNYKFPAKINYLPKMSKEKLADLYASSDIFLMPTFNDNFPTVLVESLAYGLPIITFDSGGCSEIVDENTGVVIDDRTAEGLAKAINEFDFSKYTKENCKKHAKDFSVEKFLNRYYEVYMDRTK